MECTFLTDNDSNDHSIDAEDTCHDNGDERLHDDLRSPNGDAADACACFGSAIGGSQIYLWLCVLASTSAMLTPINPKNDEPLTKSSAEGSAIYEGFDINYYVKQNNVGKICKEIGYDNVKTSKIQF